jgi:multidrug efflux system membrane fusion protein
VYVVKANNTVEQRTVVPLRTIVDDTVIEKGLRPGETIVTDGQINLIPGSTVEAKNNGGEAMAKPADQQAGSEVHAAAAADPPAGKASHPKAP